MKTIKKAFWVFMFWCTAVQIFCIIMIVKLQDTMTLGIFAGAAVLEPIAIFKFYLEYEKEIDLMHMQQNYIADYDNINNLK